MPVLQTGQPGLLAELLDDKTAGGSTSLLTESGGIKKPRDVFGGRLCSAERIKKAMELRRDGFTMRRYIGGDDRESGGLRLENGLRQSLALGGGHEDIPA